MIDLDRFKDINDTLGHHYGDLLLVELARGCARSCAHTDTIARLGGDEFGMLIPDLVERAGGLEPAVARILAALDGSFLIDGLPLHVEASIGIARYPDHGGDVDLLLQRADVAMYVAKQKGATHALYTAGARPPRHRQPDAARPSCRARSARASSCSTTSPRSTHRPASSPGVEALVRWQHPTAA